MTRQNNTQNAMQAVVQNAYGSAENLTLEEVAKPFPQADEVLVRVRAASLHPDVWHVVAGRPYVLRLMGAGLSKPKNAIPGTDMAGEVEAVGENVSRFKPGDAVFGETLSGYQWTNGGTFAQYVAVKQDRLALKPGNVSFEQAAATPTAGLIAVHNLAAVGCLKGKKVLVNGAAGGVGALALQLAKADGAQVTGVDSTQKLDMMRSLGADHVIDFTQEDFTQGRERYDLIFDIPGNHAFSACRGALTPDGKYVLIGHEGFGASGKRWLGLIPTMFQLVFLSLFSKHLPKPNFSLPSKLESMERLRALLEAGKLTPIIDRTYPLSDVREAMHYMLRGQAQGRIVLTG